MSNSSESWQWVDEDPIEKLLRRTESAAPPRAGVDALGAEGRSHFAQLKFEEAAAAYSRIVATDPKHPTAHFDLAACLEKMEQWQAAADSFRRALEVDPGRWQALVGLGACMLHLDEAEQALATFEQYLEGSAPRDAGLLGKAVALQKLGRYREAEEAYREMLDLAPDSPEPLANLIALSVAREDLSAVAQYSSLLLKFHPASKAALQGMATLAIKNGDQKAAIDYCTQLVEADPDSFEGRFNLRFAQQRMRKPEQSTRSIA